MVVCVGATALPKTKSDSQSDKFQRGEEMVGNCWICNYFDDFIFDTSNATTI